VSAPIEDRLRSVLRDRADQVRPSPPPVGLGQRAAAAARRRLVLAAVAVVVAVVVAVGAIGVLRDPRPEFIDPIVRPPKIFKLAETVSPAPGRALVAVMPGVGRRGSNARLSLQLAPIAGGPVVRLATTQDADPAPNQNLSWDGSRVVRGYAPGESGRFGLEIVNLETGKVNRLGPGPGCATLSPDNRTIAGEIDRLILLDARTGKLIRRGPDIGSCVGLGWSPDGRLLAVDSNVFDQRGRIVARLPRGHAVNQNMSWSPDGRSLLLYDEVSGRHLVRDVLGGSESALHPPAKVARTLGWSGSRVVWLVGQPGDQRLVTTDRAGANPQPWMRIDAGGRAIETVQWSWDLSGRPASED
jgi:hypothetical protein